MKRKGFTLIELLAVIVILGIIALIATPLILNVINEAKRKSYKSSAYGIMEAGNYYYASNLLYEETLEYNVNVLDKVSYKGDQPELLTHEGYGLYVKEDGKIALALYYHGYCLTKDYLETEVTDRGKIAKEDCKITVSDGTPEEPALTGNAIEVLKQYGHMKPDTTADKSLRYQGKNPNNYVRIGGENWRIVGIFKVLNGGKSEELIKVVAESIGDKAWASDGKNNWYSSPLQKELNSTFLTKLSLEEQDNIASVAWLLGGIVNGQLDVLTRGQYYSVERSGQVCCGNASTWTGKVALLNPSDYGYATDSNDAACNNVAFSNWDNEQTLSCRANNWLFTENSYWLLSPDARYNNSASYVYSNGKMVSASTVTFSRGIRPAIYLKADTMITGGKGTSTNPYKIS